MSLNIAEFIDDLSGKPKVIHGIKSVIVFPDKDPQPSQIPVAVEGESYAALIEWRNQNANPIQPTETNSSVSKTVE